MKKAFLSIATVLCVAVAGCSHAGGSTPIPTRTTQDEKQQTGFPHYRVLFNFMGSFSGGNDGAFPTGNLTYQNGLFYGTTYSGGGPGNYGTVFSVTPDGSENIVYGFQATPDGNHPMGSGLVYANGLLYGTTYDGGTDDRGTFFSVTPSGSETVLHSFRQASGPERPQAGVTDVNGTFYGVTPFGGKFKSGTIFSITPAGSLKVLHDFGGSANNDGADPLGGLSEENGVLYGSTQSGGTANMGTVYSVTTAGAEKVLHSFAGGTDGGAPWYPPAYLNGALYGTTSGFGTSTAGTIYRIDAAGTETVLYRFQNNNISPGSPHSGLVVMNGTLYGTTNAGGRFHFGTIFSVTPAGLVRVIHDFAGPPGDAETPEESNLFPLNGTLYGIAYGGADFDGAFFSLTP